MKKRQLLIPVLAGLIVGQIFAEGDRPYTIINTLRFGYDDNIDRNSDKRGSAFIEDVVNLAFRASLSDRTDLTFKSKFKYRMDDGKNQKNNFHPNIYAILTHSASQRLLLQLSDKYRSGSKTSSTVGTKGRYNYFENTVSFVPSYVLSPRDKLSAPVSYMIKRNDEEIDKEDVDAIQAGLSWERELSPQRTQLGLNLRLRKVSYPNNYSSYTNASEKVEFVSSESGYNAVEMTAELRHTFNPEWHGSIEGGVTYVVPDNPDFDLTTYSYSLTTNGVVVSTNGPNRVVRDNESRLAPFLRLGLAYEPSPRTRLDANFGYQYTEASSSSYSGVQTMSLKFGAQHDFTAKIMGRATARFVNSEYSEEDSRNSTGSGDSTEDRFDLDFRLHYKLNRINFLELGLKHTEKSYDNSNRDWNQNMIDIGWRVEL